MSDATDDEPLDGGKAVRVGLTLAAVVIVPGLANYFLGQWGYPTVGSAIWAVGYGAGAVGVWWRWIRPLDIRAPEGRSGHDEEYRN